MLSQVEVSFIEAHFSYKRAIFRASVSKVSQSNSCPKEACVGVEFAGFLHVLSPVTDCFDKYYGVRF
jgi:hypothetical protein